MSLLLLRVVPGVALLVHGGFCMEAPAATLTTLPLGLVALAAGGLLVAGFLTPLAGLIATVETLCVASGSLPDTGSIVFDSKPALIYALTILIVIMGTGPGRYSVDARMFGRREIIIPRPQPDREPKHDH